MDLEVIDSFRGRWHCFSNFYPAKILYEGIYYNSVEHAYQAAKTLDLEFRYGIAQLQSPGTAKKIGQLLPLRENWDAIKVDVMRELLALKFTEHGNTFSNDLMMTHGIPLVEGNTWHDTFWGRCRCERHEGAGANWLGTLLMMRRDELWARALHS